MQKTVVAFGETLWDLLPAARLLGGAPFNFAYRIDELGDKGIMVSRLGRDELGKQAMEKIRALGMDTTCLQWDDAHPTGTVRVSFDEANRPDYVIIPHVAYDYTELTESLLAVAARADCLCYGTLAQRCPVARDTLGRLIQAAQRAVKLLDINLRKDCYSIDTINSSLEKADVLKLNDQEACQLAEILGLPGVTVEVIAQQLVGRFGLACCVVTLGDRGVLGTSTDEGIVYVPGYDVPLVDSLGCGDAFLAAFVHKYLRGSSLAECCGYGNAMGAVVASQQGATAAVSPGDVSDFLSSQTSRISDPAWQRFAAE